MRKARIGTVAFLVEDEAHTIAMNLDRACSYVERAAALGCDVVCLPEMLRTINVAGATFDAEEITGETARRLAASAREGRINVLGNWYVRDGDDVFNQTTIFDRSGAIAGYYRKVQPTGAEAFHVRAGDTLPVFDLDFGRIAVMTCMDIYFPEIARIYAHRGAEVLFWPTVMHGPTQEGVLAQLRSRAIDNSLVVVESNMAGHPPYAPYNGRYRPATARIVDASGDILAQTGRREGIAFADVDLDEVRLTSWCVLFREPDRFREDLESMTRLDLYAREYATLLPLQSRNPEYFAACPGPADATSPESHDAP
jgi:predicted amidohydrolase